MLEFDYHIPPDVQDGAPLIVLLHGRGSHKGDLMGLQPHLPKEAIVVAPQAPYRAAELGHMGGWAWYRFLGGNRPDPETFESSQGHLRTFLQEIPGRLKVDVTLGPLFIGGFSQGATMSLAYSLRHPGEVPNVLHFSGFLADHPSVQARPDTVKGTRFFWAHGTKDAIIPWRYAEEGRRQLQAAGADLEAYDYPIGHWISPDGIRDAVDWIRRGMPGR